jgi:spermidine synthase
MTHVTTDTYDPPFVPKQLSSSRVLNLYTATIFTSAFLLFAVQPIFAKMVLPSLGGSPSVWAVSMCFFQAALLAGYCYAHLLDRLVPARIAPVVHVGLMLVALLALPFGLPTGATPPETGTYGWLIGVLAVGVGLPFFAVAANAPLLQAWFARTGHPHAADPYFLYGASNVGSLLALLSYPVLIEPTIGLATQAWTWTAGFVVLAALIATCGTAMAMRQRPAGAPSDAPAAGSLGAARVAVPAQPASPVTPATPVMWQRRLAWIALSLVPSGLLVAFTTHVTTDIASVPLLWVLPLAAYLATFIVAFRDAGPWLERLFQGMQLFSWPLVMIALLGAALPSGTGGLGLAFLAFVVVTTVAHRTLYTLRPDASHLTEFYLWMSFGGVLGGIFSSIVAPQVFDTVAEYPLLFVAALACQIGVWQRPDRREVALLVFAVGATALVVALTSAATRGELIAWPWERGQPIMWLLVATGAIAAVLHSTPHRAMILAVGALVAVLFIPRGHTPLAMERSFFGVIRVGQQADGRFHIMQHGTTLHGAERILTDEGIAVDRPVGATYYSPNGAMVRGLDVVRTAAGSTPVSVGVVGLGVGSMACYARTDEAWRYYEIDPSVVTMAKNPQLFTFLTRCPPSRGVVIGDARLTLQKEANGTFDYLVVDAFSSDAVPMHLLTREAIAMYLDRMKPEGVVALHVSSRHLDLENVATVTARSIPGVHTALVTTLRDGYTYDSSTSVVVFVSRSEAALAPFRAMPEAHEATHLDIAPWTDDYSDVVSSMYRQFVAYY